MKTDPEQMLRAVLEQVGQGRQMLSEGTVIDLTGMERDVEALCEAVLALSMQERESYVKTLDQLYEALGAFGDDLTQAREVLRQQLQGMSSHKNANMAYKRADATDNFGKREPEDE